MILDKIIELALLEDLSLGDITSDTIFTPENRAKAVIRAKEDLVLCGMETAREVFAAVDPQVRFTPLKKDGDDVKKGEEVLALEGRTLSILKAERTALNFMQRMSGIATAARAYAAVGKKYGVMIVDDRHKPTANDMTMAEWFKNSGKPFVIVANKLDKLRKRDIEPNLALIRQTLGLPETVEIIAFSAEKGDGRDALVGILQSVAGDA